MLIHIDPHSATPIYRQLTEQISRLIVTGQMRSGDQLDSVAVLSKRVRVNPMTVSKAYSWLVQEGLVERRPGIGVFVTAMDSQDMEAAGRNMLDDALTAVASLALQLNVDEEQASILLADKIRQLSIKKKAEDKKS